MEASPDQPAVLKNAGQAQLVAFVAAARMPQTILARKVDIGPSLVSKHLRGERTPKTATRLRYAAIAGVPLPAWDEPPPAAPPPAAKPRPAKSTLRRKAVKRRRRAA